MRTRKNTDTFVKMLDAHPEGVSHSEIHNWWPGGGKTRPRMAVIRAIAQTLHDQWIINITTIPSKRGRPATIYQLVRHATVSVRVPGGSVRFADKMYYGVREYILGQGRTFRQLVRKFGEEVENYLKAGFDWDGYNLFKDINKNGEHSFILLPIPAKRPVPLERDWSYHISVDPDGATQPYQMIQLPDSAFTEGGRYGKRISIVPLFDVHYGNVGCRVDKFEKYLKWIEETPGMYVILGGDLMENALDDGRGMMYDEVINPQSQLDQLTEMLAPIAHKCLVTMPGNHEHRTYKRAGIDPAKLLADRLDIPYHSGPVLLSILAGGHKFRIHAQHGFSNPATKGGKLNSAMKPMKHIDADFFLSGHVHDAIVSEDTVIREDAAHGTISFKPRWTVIAQSFMGWLGTYGYRAGYSPVAGGGILLELYENGEYVASTR